MTFFRSAFLWMACCLVPAGAAAQSDFIARHLVDSIWYSFSAADAVAWDVNEDGDLDMLYLNSGDSTVGWCQNEGDLSFTAPAVLVSLPFKPFVCQVHDLDQDGLRDLVVIDNLNDAVYALKYLGNGQFQAPQLLVVLADNIQDIEFRDINGDALPDLFFTINNNDGAEAGFQLNQGDLVLGPVNVLYNHTIYGAENIEIGDINSDGYEDAVVITANMLLSYLNDGTGAFLGAELIEGFSPIYLNAALQDLNGDDHLDLVLVQDSSQDYVEIIWYPNAGDGTFEERTILYTHIDEPIGFLVADIDGDSDNDILSQEGIHCVIHRNNGNGVFPVTDTVIVGTTSLPRFRTVDMDDDGDPDITSVGQGVGFWRNNGAGDLGDWPVMALCGVQGLNTIRLADMNGDQSPDIVTGLWSGAFWYPNDASTNFGYPHMAAHHLSQCRGLSVMDAGGDGDMDVVLASRDEGYILLSLNAGDGSFPQATLLEEGLDQPMETDTLDINQDGLTDVLFGTINGSLSVARMLSEDQSTNSLFFSNAFPGMCMTTSDVEGDGDVDLVCNTTVAYMSSRVLWLESNGNDLTTVNGILPELQGGNAGALLASDLDGDGRPEVISEYPTETMVNVVLARNLGDGTFAAPEVLLPNTSEIWASVAGDIDNDGWPEVFIAVNDSDLFMFPNLGNGTLGSPEEIPCGCRPRSLALGDKEGDGDLDLFVGCTESTATGIVFWLENGTTTLGLAQEAAPASPAVQAWPNPAKDGFMLSWPAGHHAVNIELTDALGRCVHAAQVLRADRVFVPCGQLAAGLYEVKVRSGNAMLGRQSVLIRR